MEIIGKDILIGVLLIALVVCLYFYYQLKQLCKPIVRDLTGSTKRFTYEKTKSEKGFEEKVILELWCVPPMPPCLHPGESVGETALEVKQTQAIEYLGNNVFELRVRYKKQ